MAQPSANAELGDPAYGSDARAVTYEAGEAIDAGDAVDIDSGTARAANSGDTGVDLVGVAGTTATEAGEEITVYLGGAIVTNASGTVSAGDAVAASTTDGQVDTGTGDWIALTDSGAVSGLSAGFGLGTNAAVVDLG